MFIIKHKNKFLSVGLFLVVLSLVALFGFGLNLGTDFTGGSITEMSYSEKPDISVIENSIDKLQLGNYQIQPTGESNIIVRTRYLNESERDTLHTALISAREGKLERFSATGPTISKELTERALWGVGAVIIITIIFIAIAFREVSTSEDKKDVSSWHYGLVAIITLFHDIMIPTGLFAILGRYAGVEIDILFVTALLSILGMSINDTIVIFDRIRENIKTNRESRAGEKFADLVGRSLSESFTRSLNTSIAAVSVLFALLFFGGETVRFFILALTVGMVAGVYSSLFIAAPLLVVLYERRNKA